MLGFVAALGAELASGESVLKQVSDEPTLITLTFILFIAASLVSTSPLTFHPPRPTPTCIRNPDTAHKSLSANTSCTLWTSITCAPTHLASQVS